MKWVFRQRYYPSYCYFARRKCPDITHEALESWKEGLELAAPPSFRANTELSVKAGPRQRCGSTAIAQEKKRHCQHSNAQPATGKKRRDDSSNFGAAGAFCLVLATSLNGSVLLIRL
jgi:hypothetical protein